MGTGLQGCYVTLQSPLPTLLQHVMTAAKEWIQAKAGPLKKELGSKALLLRYGIGGENYAHHDNCGDFQALLMLSKPGVDFNGGEFFMANDSKLPATMETFPFTAAGQLIIFRGNQGTGAIKYLHGMTKVTAGSAPETKRFAVGLFQ